VKNNLVQGMVIGVLTLGLCTAAAAQAPLNPKGTKGGPANGRNVCASGTSPLSPAVGPTAAELKITGLLRAPGISEDLPVCISGQESRVGLNDELWVQIAPNAPVEAKGSGSNEGSSGSPGAEPVAGEAGGRSAGADAEKKDVPPLSIDADRYVLFLNGSAAAGIGSPTLRTYRLQGTDVDQHALAFRLVRNSDNKTLWTDLLGSPKMLHRKVSVSLAVKDDQSKVQAPDIVGASGVAEFRLQVIALPWLVIATVVALLVLYVVSGHISTSTTLRDNLLPQLQPAKQPFSLGRCQMAFWFVLVFVSFVFLYILLWDYNTVSSQALALMGISGATALASVAVDVAKESPADAANRGLQALGLNSYADVQRVQLEIDGRITQEPAARADFSTRKAAAVQAKNAAASAPGDPGPAAVALAAADLADDAERKLKQLQTEIQDRRNILRTYEDRIRPFVSQGWFKDITTDINGPTVHRLQVVFWTSALGIVFIVGVYRDLAMPPDFSSTLLALMGLSGAGYVGFKFQEHNN
jgi:hypothetical protein